MNALTSSPQPTLPREVLPRPARTRGSWPRTLPMEPRTVNGLPSGTKDRNTGAECGKCPLWRQLALNRRADSGLLSQSEMRSQHRRYEWIAMRCPECDHDLSDDARYCHVCGAAQSDRSRRAGRTSTRKRELGNRVRGNRGLGSRDDIAERDETALWRGSFSAKGLIHSWLMAILLTIVMPIGASMVSASTTEWLVILTILALVWGGLGAFLAIQKLNVHYELTDQRSFTGPESCCVAPIASSSSIRMTSGTNRVSSSGSLMLAPLRSHPAIALIR